MITITKNDFTLELYDGSECFVDEFDSDREWDYIVRFKNPLFNGIKNFSVRFKVDY